MPNVTVLGPNLMIPGSPDFHVHAAGCRDISRYGRAQRYTGEFESIEDIAADWFSDIMAENEGELAEADAYVDEFKVFPCVKGLV